MAQTVAVADDGAIAAVVLAAGAGTRLRPLTQLRPKPLCPVGPRPLVDHAIDRARAVTTDVAVNVHHGRDQLEAHLAGRVHLSVEEPEALGTAGALGLLRGWIDGRPTLVLNGDTWCPAPLDPLLDGWDGERVRLYVAGSGGRIADRSRLAAALLPWRDVAPLAPVPSGLWELSWRAALAADRLEGVAVDPGTPFVDCGTPAGYLAANLALSGGMSVVGEGAVVEGELERSVVWPGAVVGAEERLVDAIRLGNGWTVLVR